MKTITASITGLIILLQFNTASAFDYILRKRGNQVISFTSTLIVPEVPIKPARGQSATHFLWPGLQPGRAADAVSYFPIDNGVLQPVLTFGPTCAPNQPPRSEPYRGWTVSGQYVNTFGSYPGYTGCLGGEFMDVSPGDRLLMDIFLIPGTTTWKQV
ncbi:hypothetical protein HDV05_003180, partial [Chytridiales sp. JEL 0842]